MTAVPAGSVARSKCPSRFELSMARSLQSGVCMRNAGLLLCILSACAADSMDPRDGRGGGGGGKADGFNDLPGAQFDAAWTIKKTDGSPAACPTGFDTIAFYSQPLDAQGKPSGNVVVDLFDCSAGSDATAEL